MSEQPFKWLDWRNRFTRYLIQPLDGVDCFQESVLLNPENNIIVLDLSEAQFLKMFSALMTGAEISYPDESLQLVADFLKGIQCPPTLVPEECFTLPTYANNIAYTPANPFIEPDLIPDGYLMQPFLVNGQNGNDFPGYEPFDVIVPFDAITFDLNFFEDIAGQLPTLQIMVQGTGSVNLKFLTSVQGGLVVVTLDNPPNLLDILAGIVTGSENIVDLNQDLVSLPPETAKELIYPVSVETGGIHTIYAVFLPILDDSLIPIRFGGGFRGLELCGFLPEGDMGIQNLRFVSCNLEQQNVDGSWSVVDGWEDWLDCVPSGGGGGGGAAMKVFTRRSAFTPSQTFTNTTFDNFTDGVANFSYIPTHSKMLVICDNIALSNGVGGNSADVRIQVAGANGQQALEMTVTGTASREVQVSDWWQGLTPGAAVAIRLQKKTNAGTATLNAQSTINWTIIEFDDISALFVEDIRIVGRDLQKKIGGAWISVSSSLATILNSIEAVANNAAAAAAAAQTTANSAQTTANGAVTVNNTQNTRLNNLESDVDDLQLSVAQHNLDIANLNSAVTALSDQVEILGFGGNWAWLHDFTIGSYLTTGTGTYSPGNGWVSSGGLLNLTYGAVQIVENQITHVEFELQITSGSATLEWSLDNGVTWMLVPSGPPGTYKGWARVPNSRAGDYFNVRFRGGFGTNLTLKHLRYLGRGLNNPFD